MRGRLLPCLAAALTLGLLCFAGCGPTLDPDVMEKTELPSLKREKVTYLKISGTLDDQNGDPVAGAKVVAQTYQGKWTDISTTFGRFNIEAIWAVGEQIDFHFTPAAESNHHTNVNWTVTIFDQDIPAGTDRITAHFQVDRAGSVRLASIEY